MATGVTSSIINSSVSYNSRFQLTTDDDTLIIRGATVTMLKPQGEIFTREGNDTVSIEDSIVKSEAEDQLAFYLGDGNDTLTVKGSTISTKIFANEGNDILTLENSVFNSTISMGAGNDTVLIQGNMQTKATLNKALSFGDGDKLLELAGILENSGGIDFGTSGTKTLRFSGGAILGTAAINGLTNMDVTLAGGTTGVNLGLSAEQTSITMNGNLFGTDSDRVISISGTTSTLAVGDNVRTNVRFELNDVNLVQAEGGTLEVSGHSWFAFVANGSSDVTLHDIVVDNGAGIYSENGAVWTVSNTDFSNSNALTPFILKGASKMTGSQLAFASNLNKGAVFLQNASVEIASFRANGNTKISGVSNVGNSSQVASGGAIYQLGGDTVLTSAVFSGNSATFSHSYESYYYNGGISASAYGGAVYASGGSLTMTSAAFSGNAARFSAYAVSGSASRWTDLNASGGAICRLNGDTVLNNVVFSGNSAAIVLSKNYGYCYSDVFGGAVCQKGGSISFTGAVFSGNKVFVDFNHYNNGRPYKNQAFGGAVYLASAIANMQDTEFSGNIASTQVQSAGASGSALVRGGAIYLDKATLSYAVTSGKNITNTGNKTLATGSGAFSTAGGWVYMANSSTLNITVENDAFLRIGDSGKYKDQSNQEDSIAGETTSLITKSGTGTLQINSDISGYSGKWTINEGTLHLRRTFQTISLDPWTIGTNGKLVLSEEKDIVNMGMSKKIGVIDMGGGSDVINTNGYDLTDGELLISTIFFNGSGRISVRLTNRNTTKGNTININGVTLDSDFTGNQYADQILINQESNLGGKLDLGGGNDVITATAKAAFTNTVKTGTGDDALTFTDVTFEKDVDLGGGTNALTASGIAIFSEKLTAGSGDDTLTFASVSIGNDLDMGDGTNTLTASGEARFNKVTGGSGDDTISLNDATTISGEINLGGGINSIFVDTTSFSVTGSVRITEEGQTTIYVNNGSKLVGNTLTVYSDETAARDSITLSWAEQTALDKVRILVSRDSSFQDYEFSVELYNQSKSFTLNLQQGYFIQFQAQDDNGWKQRLLDDHVAPNQVTGVTFNGSVLSWDETHDDLCGNGVKQYHVEVATDASFTNVIAHEIVTGTQYAPATLAEETQYFRVNAEDYTNNIGEWSETVSGMFDNTPPSRPIGGKSDVSGYSVDLSWTAATDTGSGVVQYEYRIATDSTYGEIVADGTTETCSITVDDLKYGTYSWQVRATDAAGNTGEWSLNKTFSTVDTIAPGAPANLDFGIEGGSTLSVIWDPVTDDALGSGLNRYRVQLASDAEFVTIVEDQPSTVPEITIRDLAKGDYYMRVCAVDNAENMSAWTATETFTIDTDTTPPTISDIQASTTEPTNQDVIVTATFTDNVEVASAQYRIGDGVWKEYKNGVIVTENATVYFKAVDTSGNTSAEVPFVVSNIDKTPPEMPTAEADVTTPTNKTVTVTATFTDDTVVREYSTDEQETWAEYTAPIAFDTNGTVYFRAADAVGNVSAAASYTVSNIDLIPPQKPVASADITAPTNLNVTVTATFSDDSFTKEYSLDGKVWMTYSEGVTMEDNGTVYFRGADEAGNVSDVTGFQVGNIDRTAPDKPAASANITAPTRQNVMVTATFTDDSVVREYSMDGEDWRAYTKPIWFMENGSVSFRAADEAGNVSDKTVFVVDNIISAPLEAPVLSVDVTTPTRGMVTVSATFSDLAAVKQYSVDGQTWLDYNGPLTFADNGFVVFLCIDASGECAYTAYAVMNIDKVAPEQPGAYATATAPTNRDVTVKAMFSNDSVVKEFSMDGGEDWQLYTDGIVFEDNGFVYFRGTDAAGNVSKPTMYVVTNIDKVAPDKPTVSADITEITSGPVTVSAAFSQDSVVREYSLDGENWSDYTGSIEFKDNGMSFFRGTDEAGNISLVANYAVVVIDTVAPTVSNITPSTTEPAQSVTVTAEFKDDVALESSLYKLGVSGEWTDYPVEGVVVTENTTVYFKAVDKAGNESAVASYDVTNIASVTKFVTKGDRDGNGISDVMFVWTEKWDEETQSYVTGNHAHGYWMNGTNDWWSANAWWISPEWDNLGSYDMSGDGKADAVMFGNVTTDAGIKGAYIGYYQDGDDAEGWVTIGFLDNSDNVTWQNKVGNLTGNAEGKNSIVWYAPGMYAIGAWTEGTADWVPISEDFGGSAWNLAGCGDFDGDGKDSILMSLNGSQYYTVDIEGNVQSMGASAWYNCAVRAIGDFSGDGKEDIVLFDENTGSMYMLVDGNADNYLSIGQLDPTDWFIAGCGDYNNDQKDELLVRQFSTGMLGYYNNGVQSDANWNILGYGVGMEWTVIA